MKAKFMKNRTRIQDKFKPIDADSLKQYNKMLIVKAIKSVKKEVYNF